MNCKPGDLAIVVYSLGGASIGRIVEVIRWEPTHLNHDKTFGAWRVRSNNKLQTTWGMQTDAAAKDSWLRPISGVPVEDEQHDEQPITT